LGEGDDRPPTRREAASLSLASRAEGSHRLACARWKRGEKNLLEGVRFLQESNEKEKSERGGRNGGHLSGRTVGFPTGEEKA